MNQRTLSYQERLNIAWERTKVILEANIDVLKRLAKK